MNNLYAPETIKQDEEFVGPRQVKMSGSHIRNYKTGTREIKLASAALASGGRKRLKHLMYDLYGLLDGEEDVVIDLNTGHEVGDVQPSFNVPLQDIFDNLNNDFESVEQDSAMFANFAQKEILGYSTYEQWEESATVYKVFFFNSREGFVLKSEVGINAVDIATFTLSY